MQIGGPSNFRGYPIQLPKEEPKMEGPKEIKPEMIDSAEIILKENIEKGIEGFKEFTA